MLHEKINSVCRLRRFRWVSDILNIGVSVCEYYLYT